MIRATIVLAGVLAATSAWPHTGPHEDKKAGTMKDLKEHAEPMRQHPDKVAE